ncbi:diacylglycerol lipase-beta-like [Sycon ciliatum]|uniref:diacylglycerol lipase-beta-like n=1 Tax=Sycon ciliatum TaxID=27933 RepID=UPI0031F6B4B1
MPAIKACGRRLHVSTDDFFFPGVFSVFLRLVWLILTAVVINFYQKEKDDCANSGHILDVYLYGALVLTSVVGLLDMAIAYHSSRGSISNTAARRAVPGLLVARIVMAFPELAWLVLGTIWAWRPDLHGAPCPERDLTMVRVAVTSAWVLFSVLAFLGLGVIDWLGSSKVPSADVSDAGHSFDEDCQLTGSARHRHEEMWERRCDLCCCMCFRGSKKSDPEYRTTLLEVSQIFASFFSSQVDIVPTDIAAGMLLVAEVQQLRLRRDWQSNETCLASAVSVPPSAAATGAAGVDDNGDTRVVPIGQEQQCVTEYGPCLAWGHIGNDGAKTFSASTMGIVSLSEQANREAYEPVVHFMKFAMGPYGWPLFIYERLLTGCCRLLPYCQCCVECQSREAIVDKDCPGSHCNTAAILSWTGIQYDDIIYATFDAELMQLPFFVAVDHSHDAVVVSIRGTMSLKDALADMRAAPRAMGVDGHPEFMAHDGMLESAMRIRRRMQQMRLLETAFQRASRRGMNYDLVFVGHSLGAGVASVLSVLYRAEYPSLRCYAYSPPGALLNKECSLFSSEFTVSVILGDDVVPRLSIPALEDLRVDIIDALTKTTHSKPHILCVVCCSTFLPCFCCCQHLDVDIEAASSSYPSACLESSSYRDQDESPEPVLGQPGASLVAATIPPMPSSDADGGRAVASTGPRRGREIFYTRYTMYPPGRLLHVVEDSDAKNSCCSGEPSRSLRWIPFNSLQNVRVSSKMIKDHLPNHVNAALEQVYDGSFYQRRHLRQEAV